MPHRIGLWYLKASLYCNYMIELLVKSLFRKLLMFVSVLVLLVLCSCVLIEQYCTWVFTSSTNKQLNMTSSWLQSQTLKSHSILLFLFRFLSLFKIYSCFQTVCLVWLNQLTLSCYLDQTTKRFHNGSENSGYPDQCLHVYILALKFSAPFKTGSLCSIIYWL